MKRNLKEVYKNAPIKPCACGCGELIKTKDIYGRDKRFVAGHGRRKYKDPSQHKREWNHRNRDKRFKYKTNYIHSRKSKFIISKGGKCAVCGYEYTGENACCFDFHHRENEDKSFNLNLDYINRKSMKLLLEELNKCDLLCAICHRKIHSEKY